MSKYNIAQFGTFDLENFGDLLFPDVLEKNIRARISDANLVLFSPVGGKKPFEENVEVYPIKDFEKLHQEYDFDAIILGGGDLLRLDMTLTRQGSYNSDDPSFELFVLPAVFADKYHIPLIYNVPGAPYRFEQASAELVRASAKAASYFSLRDEKSAEYFREHLNEDELEINIAPDSIVDIAAVYPLASLGTRFEKFANDYSISDNNYVVFQNISALSDENVATFADELSQLAENNGVDIVFMPINYVHGDEPIMREIFGKMSTERKKFVDEHLAPVEMIALLAHSCGYIGSSLHGAIVSMAYGKKACALNLLKLSKLGGIFALFGIDSNLVTDCSQICKTFENAIVLERSKIEELVLDVSEHFDTICDIITGRNAEYKPKCGFADEIVRKYHELSQYYEKHNAKPCAKIYFDYGEGFSEQNTITPEYTFVGDRYCISLNIENTVKKLRFDPIEGRGCILTDFEVTGSRNINLEFFGGVDGKNSALFYSADPNVVISGVEGLKKVEIFFGYIPLCDDDNARALTEVATVFEATATENTQLNSELSQTKNALAQESAKAQAFSEKNDFLNSTLCDERMQFDRERNIFDAERKGFEKSKKEYDAKVLMLNTATNEMSAMLRDKDAKIAELQSALTQTRESFCWKATAPIRGASMIARRSLPGKILSSLKNNGVKGTISKIKNRRNAKAQIKEMNHDYDISDEVRKKQENTVFSDDITFSVLVPLYNTPKEYLCAMIESVQAQTYKKWELVLADGSDPEHAYVGKIAKKYAGADKRIIYKKLEKNGGISENTNECIKLAGGEYIALFDHDDILHPSALFEIAGVIETKNADYVYTDENTFSEHPHDAYNPHFKPDYSPDTLRSYNYICHFSVFSRKLLDSVGYFNKEYDGSQDYDIILRLTEKAERIVHIPKILYYWRAHKNSVASDISAKPYTVTAAKKALAAHLERVGLKGEVLDSKILTTYRIKYEIKGEPLISIIIPTKDHIDDLKKCLDSIYEKSTYKNFEIIVIENNSTENSTFEYYEELKSTRDNLRIVVWEEGFNYSAINNFGIKFAKGEYILLLNNDVEVITPEWLEEMLMFAQRSDVGAVGSMLYYPDDTIQHAGVILGIGGVAGHSHKYMKRSDDGYFARITIAQNLSCCTAACLMMSKAVFDEIDGLDEDFAVAFNDVDLCMRIRQKGYLIVFTPYSQLYHYESKSRGLEDTPEKQKRFAGEIARFDSKWRAQLDEGDPYYNPNLTLVREDFSFK